MTTKQRRYQRGLTKLLFPNNAAPSQPSLRKKKNAYIYLIVKVFL